MSRPAETWADWAGDITAAPQQIERPDRPEEMAELIIRAAREGRRVKAVGSGRSISGIAATDGLQLRLDHFSGLIRLDPARQRVTVASGTRLADLVQLLHASGLALDNLCNTDQTIAGALSTGAYGTGDRRAGLAGSVRGLEMITADGSRLRCSPHENREVFDAARVGLGALGVITEITLQCVPSFQLRIIETAASFDAALADFPPQVVDHDHVGFFWFPHTNRVLTKRTDRLPVDRWDEALPHWRYPLNGELSRGAYELANHSGTGRRGGILTITATSSPTLTSRQDIDASYEVFSSPHQLRSVESEYAIPGHALEPVLRELRRWVDDHDQRIDLPVQVRVAAADDAWLSTGYQRNNVYVAVHQHHRLDHSRYFAAFEAIVAEHQGRPHWGKMHGLDSERLRALYPRFDDFRRVRDQLDPARLFRNDYLDRVLGQ